MKQNENGALALPSQNAPNNLTTTTNHKKQPPTSQQEVIHYLFCLMTFRAFVIGFVDAIWTV